MGAPGGATKPLQVGFPRSLRRVCWECLPWRDALCVVMPITIIDIFQVCLFFRNGKQWNLLLSGFYKGNWYMKNDAMGFLQNKKTSLLRFWHQKIDWGKSDSHIHLIPSPPAGNYMLDLRWMLYLAVELWLAYEITCASPVFQHHKVEKKTPHLPIC